MYDLLWTVVALAEARWQVGGLFFGRGSLFVHIALPRMSFFCPKRGQPALRMALRFLSAPAGESRARLEQEGEREEEQEEDDEALCASAASAPLRFLSAPAGESRTRRERGKHSLA